MYIRKSYNKCTNHNIGTEDKSLINLERITGATKPKIETIEQTVKIIEINLVKIEKRERASAQRTREKFSS